LHVLHDTLVEQELPVGQLAVLLHRLTLVQSACTRACMHTCLRQRLRAVC